MKRSRKHITLLIMVFFLITGLVVLASCKKKSGSGTSMGIESIASGEEILQKNCPVMGGAINKDIFTEYKGKKVYFCCASCKEAFEKEPEKYLSKLPQFNESD